MFSGRVNRGMCPRMTMRSKQWYTKTSRLPNSLVKVSIGPPRCSCVDNKIIGQAGRWNPAMKRREGFPRTQGLAEGTRVNLGDLSDYGQLSARGIIRTDQPTPARMLFDRGQSG